MNRIPGSFRDPSGFVFVEEGVLYRQINKVHASSYGCLVESGLYDALTCKRWLIPHQELEGHGWSGAWKVIRPAKVPFISYPYEWCFSQLKAAALLTLDIQEEALRHGLSLRDASAYNIQFIDGRPILIDTLSFEPYVEGLPWIPYQQFCRQFLGPLALMAHVNSRLSQLLRVHVEGVPLDLVSRILPVRSHCRLSLLLHIHLHARASTHGDGAATNVDRASNRQMSRRALLGLVNSLRTAVERLRPAVTHTEWSDYYASTNYTEESQGHKAATVGEFVSRIGARRVWDLGANTGVYSRIAARHADLVISLDMDHAAVERQYQECLSRGETKILPLTQDLMNPSGGIGWASTERQSLVSRGPADLALMLALVHHLAIANNVPLDHIAQFAATICSNLVIEFVPKSDSQVQRLLRTRHDIFPDYTLEGFEAAFRQFFQWTDRVPIRGSDRVLYLMQRAES